MHRNLRFPFRRPRRGDPGSRAADNTRSRVRYSRHRGSRRLLPTTGLARAAAGVGRLRFRARSYTCLNQACRDRALEDSNSIGSTLHRNLRLDWGVMPLGFFGSVALPPLPATLVINSKKAHASALKVFPNLSKNGRSETREATILNRYIFPPSVPICVVLKRCL